MYLQMLGHEVVTVYRAVEAIERADNFSPRFACATSASLICKDLVYNRRLAWSRQFLKYYHMALLSITYLSVATVPFSDLDLIALLQKSRAKNQRMQITGMLLYFPNNFLQTLEGPEAAVQELFAEIQQDLRHKSVHVLIREWADKRDFPEWTMGFRRASASFQQEPLNGFSDLLSRREEAMRPDQSERKPGRIHALFLHLLNRA